MPREATARQPLCADIDGSSLHAAVRVEANDRKRLEQLGRYITRPALSDERVQLNAAGRVELKLKTPWRDGTTHLVMSPLEFMQRLGAAAQARLRDRHAALTELWRRRAEDHRGHPRAAGDREDLHPPRAGSAAAAPWPGARGGPNLGALSPG